MQEGIRLELLGSQTLPSLFQDQFVPLYGSQHHQETKMFASANLAHLIEQMSPPSLASQDSHPATLTRPFHFDAAPRGQQLLLGIYVSRRDIR